MLDEDHGSKGGGVIANDGEEVDQSVVEMCRANDSEGDEAIKFRRLTSKPARGHEVKTHMAVAAIENTHRGTYAKTGATHWKLMPNEYIVGAHAAGIPDKQMKEEPRTINEYCGVRHIGLGRLTHRQNNHAEFAKFASGLESSSQQPADSVCKVSIAPGLVNERGGRKGGAENFQQAEREEEPEVGVREHLDLGDTGRHVGCVIGGQGGPGDHKAGDRSSERQDGRSFRWELGGLNIAQLRSGKGGCHK